MARTKGSTNDTIYESFSTVNKNYNSIENLMLAVYEQAIRDYTYLLKNDLKQSQRTQMSIEDITDFLDNSSKYYSSFIDINGQKILERLTKYYEFYGKDDASDKIIENLHKEKTPKKDNIQFLGDTYEIELDKRVLIRNGIDTHVDYKNNYTDLVDRKFSFHNQCFSEEDKKFISKYQDSYNRIKEMYKAKEICNEYDIEK